MEVKPSYKQTEVGLIPEDWEVPRLAGICSMKSGEGITTANIDQFSQYPCYGGNGLRGFTTRFTHDGCHALIGRQGALCGNVLGVEGRFFASEHAIVVTGSSRTDIRWLTFVLGRMRLNQYSESSAQPGLSVQKLLSLPLALPPTKSEQTAIAEALSDADVLIESLEQLIAKKRRIKQGAMREILTGKKRLPGFRGQWDVTTLRELGQWRGGGTPSKRNAEFWSGHILWVSPKDFKGTTIRETEDHITQQAVERSSTVLIKKNSILIVTRSGVLRHTVPVATNAVDVAINQDVKALTVLDRAIPSYILQVLLTFSDQIRESTVKVGTTVESIDFAALCRFKIPIPPLPEQTAIAEILSDMDAEIVAFEAKLGKARQVKRGMMQELLTGRIRLL